MRLVSCLLMLAAVSAVAAGKAADLEVRLPSVAIEGGDIRGFSADARAELEKHLALVAGTKCGALGERALPCGAQSGRAAELTIVLGQRAPGAGEPWLFCRGMRS